MSQMPAGIRSLLLLSSSLCLAWGVCFAQDADRRVQERCPGVTAWEQRHPEAKVIDPQPHPSLPEVRLRLLDMEKKDQEARSRFVEQGETPGVLQEMIETDARNLKELKGILARHGVPDAAQVGTDGVGALWLLTQHASADVALQKQVLARLTESNTGIDPGEIAMLTDRIRISEGKPQLYGTQFHQVRGALEPYPIEDARDVDVRRAEKGLMPLKDYRCALNASANPNAGERDTGA